MTMRDAVIGRIANPPRYVDDNLGLGMFWFAVSVVLFAIVVAICCTVYYSLKLYAS